LLSEAIRFLKAFGIVKPGIGVEINEEGMKKYAIQGVPFFE